MFIGAVLQQANLIILAQRTEIFRGFGLCGGKACDGRVLRHQGLHGLPDGTHLRGGQGLVGHIGVEAVPQGMLDAHPGFRAQGPPGRRQQQKLQGAFIDAPAFLVLQGEYPHLRAAFGLSVQRKGRAPVADAESAFFQAQFLQQGKIGHAAGTGNLPAVDGQFHGIHLVFARGGTQNMRMEGMALRVSSAGSCLRRS